MTTGRPELLAAARLQSFLMIPSFATIAADAAIAAASSSSLRRQRILCRLSSTD